MSKKAFTLAELLCTMTILVCLAGLLFPVFSSSLLSARTTASASNLHQVAIGLAIYRSQYDGEGVYGPASRMGLPTLNEVYYGAIPPDRLIPGTLGFWQSPCGTHPKASISPGARTNYGYFASDDTDEAWINYVQQQGDNAIVMHDKNCNDPEVSLSSIMMPKLVLGLSLSGTVIRRVTTKPADYALWFMSGDKQR